MLNDLFKSREEREKESKSLFSRMFFFSIFFSILGLIWIVTETRGMIRDHHFRNYGENISGEIVQVKPVNAYRRGHQLYEHLVEFSTSKQNTSEKSYSSYTSTNKKSGILNVVYCSYYPDVLLSSSSFNDTVSPWVRIGIAILFTLGSSFVAWWVKFKKQKVLG